MTSFCKACKLNILPVNQAGMPQESDLDECLSGLLD